MVSRLTVVLTLVGLSTSAEAFQSFHHRSSSWHRARRGSITPFAEAQKKCDPVSCPPPPPPPPKPEAKAKGGKGPEKGGKSTEVAAPELKSEAGAVTPVTAEAVTSPGDPKSALYFIGGANVVAGLAYWRQRRTGGDPIAEANKTPRKKTPRENLVDEFIDEFYFRAEKPPPKVEKSFRTEFSFPKEEVAEPEPEPEPEPQPEPQPEPEPQVVVAVEDRWAVEKEAEQVEEKKVEVDKKVVVVGGQEVVVAGGAGSTPVVSAAEEKAEEAVDEIAAVKTPTQGYGSNPRLVKFTKAVKQLMDGEMGKREFLKSRAYRIARKVNPATTCDDEESCEIEIDEADPTLVEMAEDGKF